MYRTVERYLPPRAPAQPGPVTIDMTGVGEALGDRIARAVRDALPPPPPEAAKSLRAVIRAVKDLGGATGSAGGYTLPAELAREILALPVPNVVRSRAVRLEMNTRSLSVPTLDQGDGLAGMTLTWGTAEGGPKVETEPAFGEVELAAEKLAGVIIASDELLADAAAETYLRTLAARAVNWYVDRAAIVGDGTGEPLGALESPAAISVPRATAGQVRAADLAALLGRLHPSCYNPDTACYLVSPTALTDLASSLDLAGKPLSWAGLPIIPCEHLSPLGTAKDAALIDFGCYLLGERSLEIALSREGAGFVNDQTAVRVVWRGDGAPWLGEAVPYAGDAASSGSCAVYLDDAGA